MDHLHLDDMLDTTYSLAKVLAREAGKLIRDGRVSKSYGIDNKIGVDLVTAIDKACEDLIITKLKKEYPSHAFIGEESSGELPSNADGSLQMDAGVPTWLIDPLDGTTNFVTGQNDVVVSIALAVSGDVVFGVVYNPFLDELYSARKGLGAFCNDIPIHCGTDGDLSKLVIMNNIGASRDGDFISKSVARIDRLLRAGIRGMRCGGSCAMNMCYVASGRMGIYFEVGFGGPWDVAAGKIIVEESFGVVKAAPSGTDFKLMAGKGNVLCGCSSGCEAVAKLLIEADISSSRH